jgi:hypothetical protein
MRVGASVLGLYMVVAFATMAVSHRHVRPFFEGFGTQQIPYKWVNPPASLSAGNQVPQPSTTDAPLDAAGSKAIGITTEDGQLVLNLPAGAVAAHGADTLVRVALTPLDPAKLATVPAGLTADGNAYQVQLAYQPSGAPATIAVAGNIILTVPTAGTSILQSADASSWQPLATQPVGGPTVIGGQFTGPGYFLGAAVKHKAATPKSSSVPTVLLAAITAALALTIFLLPYGWRRLRRGGAPAKGPSKAPSRREVQARRAAATRRKANRRKR